MELENFYVERKVHSGEAASAAGGCWELNVSWKTKCSAGADRWREGFQSNEMVKNQRRAELRRVQKNRTRGADGKYDQQMVNPDGPESGMLRNKVTLGF